MDILEKLGCGQFVGKFKGIPFHHLTFDQNLLGLVLSVYQLVKFYIKLYQELSEESDYIQLCIIIVILISSSLTAFFGFNNFINKKARHLLEAEWICVVFWIMIFPGIGQIKFILLFLVKLYEYFWGKEESDKISKEKNRLREWFFIKEALYETAPLTLVLSYFYFRDFESFPGIIGAIKILMGKIIRLQFFNIAIEYGEFFTILASLALISRRLLGQRISSMPYLFKDGAYFKSLNLAEIFLFLCSRFTALSAGLIIINSLLPKSNLLFSLLLIFVPIIILRLGFARLFSGVFFKPKHFSSQPTPGLANGQEIPPTLAKDDQIRISQMLKSRRHKFYRKFASTWIIYPFELIKQSNTPWNYGAPFYFVAENVLIIVVHGIWAIWNDSPEHRDRTMILSTICITSAIAWLFIYQLRVHLQSEMLKDPSSPIHLIRSLKNFINYMLNNSFTTLMNEKGEPLKEFEDLCDNLAKVCEKSIPLLGLNPATRNYLNSIQNEIKKVMHSELGINAKGTEICCANTPLDILLFHTQILVLAGYGRIYYRRKYNKNGMKSRLLFILGKTVELIENASKEFDWVEETLVDLDIKMHLDYTTRMEEAYALIKQDIYESEQANNLRRNGVKHEPKFWKWLTDDSGKTQNSVPTPEEYLGRWEDPTRSESRRSPAASNLKYVPKDQLFNPDETLRRRDAPIKEGMSTAD